MSPWPPLTLAILRDIPQLLAWSGEIVTLVLLDAAQSLLLGALLVLSLGQPTAERRRPARLLSFVCGCGLSCALKSIAVGGRPHDWDLIMTASATAIGVWLGTAVYRGWRGVLQLIPQTLVLVLIVGTGLMFAYEKLVSKSPSLSRSVDVTIDSKQALVSRLRHELIRPGPNPDKTRLELSQTDADALLDWGLSNKKTPLAVGVRMREGLVEIVTSAPVPVFAGGYLNLHCVLAVELRQSALIWRVVGGRVGRVPLPARVLDDLLRPVVNEVLLIPEVQTVRRAVQTLVLTDGALIVEGPRDQLRNSVLPLLRTESQPDDGQLRRIRIYCDFALECASRLPEGDRKLTDLMRALFRMAGRRSVSADPVLENQAALLALAYLIGDRPVPTLIGPVMTAEELRVAARRLGHMTIRGRQDLARHMLVSCALAMLSNEEFSAMLGLWKERLDAENGSGFSFVDLLADRVGLRLAQRATGDRASALLLQYRLRRTWEPADLFPPIAGLPEGIRRSEFERRYGGGRGAVFERLEREIEARIQNCQILQ
jgi:hypothetical protein